jgi:hypothetical protein
MTPASFDFTLHKVTYIYKKQTSSEVPTSVVAAWKFLGAAAYSIASISAKPSLSTRKDVDFNLSTYS